MPRFADASSVYDPICLWVISCGVSLRNIKNSSLEFRNELAATIGRDSGRNSMGKNAQFCSQVCHWDCVSLLGEPVYHYEEINLVEGEPTMSA